jgi:hypothetical protein
MTSLTRLDVIPANGPATDFSAELALEYVSAISQAHHPPGSEEIERVRTYILAQLDAMGLSPEVQKTSLAVPQDTAAIGIPSFFVILLLDFVHFPIGSADPHANLAVGYLNTVMMVLSAQPTML